jgi:molybdopterin adenylyltransferase
MGVEDHRATSPPSVRCFTLTISDSRTAETDTSGRAIAEMLGAAGHQLLGHAIVRDDPSAVRRVLYEQIGGGHAQVIITTGGTGITSRDSTYEAISGILEKRLDGFGELFRMISYEQIGSAAMLSRACAGTARGRAIFALPGSEAAVRLAMTKLILPELGHIVRERSR